MLSSPRKVLLIEKSIAHMHLLNEIMDQEGYMVTTANSGQEALDLLSDAGYRPDVIFLAVDLGDMTGLQVLQVYRFGVATPAPVFFIVEDALADSLVQLRDSGASGVINKPLQSQDIMEAMRNTFVEAQAPPRLRAVAAGGQVSTWIPETHRTSQQSPYLCAVPTLYVDTGVLGELATISCRPEFILELLDHAITDISSEIESISVAIDGGRWSDVKKVAHALKGVALQMGAIQLGRYADLIVRLAELSPQSDWRKLRAELARVGASSVEALRKERDGRRQQIRTKPG